jgi:gamma-glutamylcysteine synthetase
VLVAQVHVAVTDAEMPLITSVCNAATPAIVALCGNSAVHSGVAGTAVCTRESGKGDSLGHRHGMPTGPIANVRDFVEQVTAFPYLMARPASFGLGPSLANVCGTAAGPANERTYLPFRAHWEGTGSTDWDDFAFHDHYVWHSARPRAKQGTVEIRPACQQPMADHMVVATLGLGIAESAADLAPVLARFGKEAYAAAAASATPAAAAAAAAKAAAAMPVSGLDAWGLQGEAWAGLLALHHTGSRTGLADPVVRAMSAAVVAHAEAGLLKRGLGEEKFLAPLHARLASATNPGQAYAALLAKSGALAVVDACAGRPKGM